MTADPVATRGARGAAKIVRKPPEDARHTNDFARRLNFHVGCDEAPPATQTAGALV